MFTIPNRSQKNKTTASCDVMSNLMHFLHVLSLWWQNVLKHPPAACFVNLYQQRYNLSFVCIHVCVCVHTCVWVAWCCVLLSPHQSVLNWILLLLWGHYKATAACISVSYVDWDYIKTDHVLWMSCRCLIAWLLWFDEAKAKQGLTLGVMKRERERVCQNVLL